MTTKKIQINGYVFHLSINANNDIVSGHFEYLKNRHRDMTREELFTGQQILDNIFDGKYNDRVFKKQFSNSSQN